MLLQRQWRQGGSAKFRTTKLYVNDDLNTFVGPVTAFFEAAQGEIPFTDFRRPSVRSAGIEAALAEIRTQGGPLVERDEGLGV